MSSSAFRVLSGPVLGIIAFLWAPFAGAATYYVAADGRDAADGRTPNTAWQTLDRVNAAALQPGDSVLFRRGDQWRGSLRPKSGRAGSPITYGAFGRGEKPRLLGSIAKNRPEDWKRLDGDVWISGSGPKDWPRPVGNVIFDDGASCGVMRWKAEELKDPGDHWFDPVAKHLRLVSPRNPAETYRNIECALTRHVIDQSGVSYATYQDLAVLYGAAHGIGGGNTRGITVRRCDFGFIGGGLMMLGKRPVRYGNGIEFWGAARNHLVEQCRLWEVYDAALTNQNQSDVIEQSDITYRHNVIWNCEYSFEYWNRPAASQTRNILFENNTCVRAGYGWGHRQRPDPTGTHLMFYASPAKAEGIVVRNNIFHDARFAMLYAPDYAQPALDAIRMDYNVVFQTSGLTALLKGRRYGPTEFAAYQQATGRDQHSLAADPRLVDLAKADFRLRPNSPCIDSGEPTGAPLDFAGTRLPQGGRIDRGAIEATGTNAAPNATAPAVPNAANSSNAAGSRQPHRWVPLPACPAVDNRH